MNKKLLLIVLIIILIFAVIIYLFNNKSSASNASSTTFINIPKTNFRDLTKNFIEINNVSFFEPYLLNINFSDISGGVYPIVEEIKFLGFYFEGDNKIVYVLENNLVKKYDIKDLISQRYYILKASEYQLIVLDTSEGTIKLIISNSYGGNEL